MVLQTSLADLGDTLSSRPLAFAVFSGSSSSTEYPHSGMVDFSNWQSTERVGVYMLFYMSTFDVASSAFVLFIDPL